MFPLLPIFPFFALSCSYPYNIVVEKLERVREICRRRNVALAYLFGSQKDMAYHILLGQEAVISDPLADIDLGLVFNPSLTQLSTPSPSPNPPRHILYAELHNELSELFEPYHLDLVFLEEGHSVFQLEAIKGRCIYQASETFRTDYEMIILRKAADFSYVLQAFAREALEQF